MEVLVTLRGCSHAEAEEKVKELRALYSDIHYTLEVVLMLEDGTSETLWSDSAMWKQQFENEL